MKLEQVTTDVQALRPPGLVGEVQQAGRPEVAVQVRWGRRRRWPRWWEQFLHELPWLDRTVPPPWLLDLPEDVLRAWKAGPRLEVARVAGVLVSLLNTGSTDWSGPEALKTLPLRGWGEDFAQALQDGGWPGALVEVVGLVSAGLPQSAPGEVVDHLRLPRPVLLTLAVAEAVALAEEGARLARCKVGGHYFFAPGRGRLPGYCPLHGLVRRREAVRERVRAWRAKRRR